MSTPYDDMLHLPHHVSENHPPMSRLDRAAQFAPFAALTGYDAAVRETARLTHRRIELDEEEKAVIDRRLALVRRRLPESTEVRVTYFVPDERKEGGRYVSVTGRVKKLDDQQRTVLLTDGTVIPVDGILSVEGGAFADGESFL